jgi:hypothetical protein
VTPEVSEEVPLYAKPHAKLDTTGRVLHTEPRSLP